MPKQAYVMAFGEGGVIKNYLLDNCSILFKC
jgi:hypothetical protein